MATMPPDDFRKNHCYIAGTCEVLRANETALRKIFTELNKWSGPDLPGGKAASYLSLGEWMTLLKALGLIAGDITERDAVMCFVNSRMIVINGWSDAGRVRESELPFEGFMEALCRLSVLKALPTDGELDAAKEPDAGRYLMRMAMEDEDKYEHLIESRAVAWGDEPYQPVESCVRHLLSLIYWRMQDKPHEVDSAREGNVGKMIAQFFKSKRGGNG